MRKPFVPEDFAVPQCVTLDKTYSLFPITVKNVHEDWRVIRQNAATIHMIRGGGSRNNWPFRCTLKENYKDLAWLELCATYKQLFAYIIRRKKDNRYIGCIYIYPIELFFPKKAKKYDVDFSFWIVKEAFDTGKYEKFTVSLMNWLGRYWPFEKKRIFFRNALVPKN